MFFNLLPFWNLYSADSYILFLLFHMLGDNMWRQIWRRKTTQFVISVINIENLFINNSKIFHDLLRISLIQYSGQGQSGYHILYYTVNKSSCSRLLVLGLMFSTQVIECLLLMCVNFCLTFKYSFLKYFTHLRSRQCWWFCWTRQ